MILYKIYSKSSLIKYYYIIIHYRSTYISLPDSVLLTQTKLFFGIYNKKKESITWYSYL